MEREQLGVKVKSIGNHKKEIDKPTEGTNEMERLIESILDLLPIPVITL